jgi:hypothetical protein
MKNYTISLFSIALCASGHAVLDHQKFSEDKKNFQAEWGKVSHAKSGQVHNPGSVHVVDKIAAQLIPYLSEMYEGFSKSLSKEDRLLLEELKKEGIGIPSGYVIFQKLTENLAGIYAYRAKKIDNPALRKKFIESAKSVFSIASLDIQHENTQTRSTVCQDGYVNRLLEAALLLDDTVLFALGSDLVFEEGQIQLNKKGYVKEDFDLADYFFEDVLQKSEEAEFLYSQCQDVLENQKDSDEYPVCKALNLYLISVMDALHPKEEKEFFSKCPAAIAALRLYGIWSSKTPEWKLGKSEELCRLFDKASDEIAKENCEELNTTSEIQEERFITRISEWESLQLCKSDKDEESLKNNWELIHSILSNNDKKSSLYNMCEYLQSYLRFSIVSLYQCDYEKESLPNCLSARIALNIVSYLSEDTKRCDQWFQPVEEVLNSAQKFIFEQPLEVHIDPEEIQRLQKEEEKTFSELAKKICPDRDLTK